MLLHLFIIGFSLMFLSGCSLTSVTVIEHEDTQEAQVFTSDDRKDSGLGSKRDRLQEEQTVLSLDTGLKTFTDTRLGFAFQYPKDWIVQPFPSSNYIKSETRFVSPADESVYFSVAVVSSQLEKVEPVYQEGQGYEKSKVLLDSRGATLYTWEEGGRRDYLIEVDGDRFRLIASPYTSPEVAVIVDSFHFARK